MKPSDNFEKPPQNPTKIKVDEKRTPSARDNRLMQKLKIFCQDIHHRFIGSTNDSMIGPQVFLPNLLVKQLCNLARIHVFQSLDDLSDNIQWSWLPKHGNTLITIIHSVYPPQPVPTPNPPIAFHIQPCPVEMISGGSSQQPRVPSICQGKQQKCMLCTMLGHKSESFTGVISDVTMI